MTQNTGRGAIPCSPAVAVAVLTRSPRGTASAACRRAARRRSSRATVARASPEIRRARSPSSRRRTTASASASGSSGATSRPLTPSRTSSGMPEIGVVTTGVARGHRLDEHVGDAVAVAVVEHPARHAERGRAAVLGEQLLLAHRAREPDAAVEAELGDAAAQSRAVLVVLADDHGLERDAAAVEHAARVDERRRSPSWPRGGRRRERAASRWGRAPPRLSPLASAARSRRSGRGRRGGRRASGAMAFRWRALASVQVTTKRAASSLRRSQPCGFSAGE